jgi:hypothetical protein
MDCRTFRKHHLEFVDDTLSALDTVGMRRHLDECELCARHDTAVRRSLLVVRNLPRIEPSADFGARLDARLRQIGPIDYRAIPRARSRSLGLGALIATAASIATFGYLSVAAMELDGSASQVALAPILASRPEPVAPPIADPAIVASASMTMPVWPTVYMADQAQMHFARLASFPGR